MFELFGSLIAAVAFVAFILWDILRTQKPIDRKTLEAGFDPGLASKVTALFVLGAVGIFFGLYLIAHPEHPPFSGRGALISSILYALFGLYGQPLVCFGLSITAIAGAFAVKKRKSLQKETPYAG